MCGQHVPPDDPWVNGYLEHRYLRPGRDLGYWLHQHRIPLLPALVRMALRIVFGSDVPVRMYIPKSVLFLHNGLGTVVHDGVTFRGPALIHQNVTLGRSFSANDGPPTIGRYVFIGAGATVLGNITIGDCTVIGANAVVTKDVPPLHAALGVPARNRPLDPEFIRKVFKVDPSEVLRNDS